MSKSERIVFLRFTLFFVALTWLTNRYQGFWVAPGLWLFIFLVFCTLFFFTLFYHTISTCLNSNFENNFTKHTKHAPIYFFLASLYTLPHHHVWMNNTLQAKQSIHPRVVYAFLWQAARTRTAHRTRRLGLAFLKLVCYDFWFTDLCFMLFLPPPF